jgi:hypothetical protein
MDFFLGLGQTHHRVDGGVEFLHIDVEGTPFPPKILDQISSSNVYPSPGLV